MKTKRTPSTRAACAAQHFGVWCANPQWHRDTVAAIRSGLYKPQVEANTIEPLAYDVVDRTAVIPVDDMLTKGRSSFGGTSMMELAQIIRDADRDPRVDRVMLEIDSPGGTYVGFEAVAYALKNLTKPSIAKVSDWAASGALLVAVHCDNVVLNRTGQVGSIGAYTVLLDSSKADEKEGNDWILITSGGLKGAGADGRVSPELKADCQKDIDRITGEFIAMVADQRGLSIDAVRALADGRMFTAEESLRLGLIDRVIDETDAETFLNQEQSMTREEFIAHASQHPTDLQDAAKDLISTEVAKVQTAANPPATLEQLETAFPGDEKFVIGQLRAKASIADAREAHRQSLVAQVATLKGEVEQANIRLAEADPGSAGLPGAINAAAPKKVDGGSLLTDLIDKQAKQG